MSFTQKLIDVVITAGPATESYTPPTFGPNKSNTLTLTGHRVRSTITQAGMLSLPMCEIAIFGMTEDEMNAISSLGQPYYFANQNSVALVAGDVETGKALAFEGGMSSALIDFTAAPDVSFNILATNGLDFAMSAAAASNYPGAVSIGTICQQLAAAMGLTLENNGCSQVLRDQYLPGTMLDQLQAATQAANVNYVIQHGTLAIWPKAGYRTIQANGQTIGPSSGLVGYPSYTNFGVDFRTLYNPSLLYGANVTLQSSQRPACGDWTVYNMTHSLNSMDPDAAWFTDAQTVKPGFFPLVTG